MDNNSSPTLAENDKLLYKLVIQFLIFSQGSHKALEPHLLQIGKCLKSGASLNELTRELQAISKTLLHISKQTKQEVRVDDEDSSGVVQSDYLLSRLDELLTDPVVPLRLHQQTALLKQRTRTGFNGQSYKKIIDSAITLLLNIRDYANAEQQGLDTFLTGMAQELNQIERQAEMAGQANQLSIDNRDNLNTAIHRQVDSIRDTTRNAKELSALKDHTSEHLDLLMQQLIEHKQQEDQRQQQAREQIEIMTRKLQDLETETETLRTKLKIEHDKALRDSLTGLPNRSAYNTRVEMEFARWSRYQAPLALAIWDIDYFKRINDTYGHKAGDKTLALVGQLLLTNCRETDFVARYGGEEFVMLMPNTDSAQALSMAENIREVIRNCGFNFNGEDINLSLCCGISEFKEGDQHDDVFVRADQALYLCKQLGRNRCAVFDDDSSQD